MHDRLRETSERYAQLLTSVFLAMLLGLLWNTVSNKFPVPPKGREPQKVESYSQRLETLTESLLEASAEVDTVLKELAEVAQERQEAAQKLKAELEQLQEQEKELQKRVEELQDVPIPVADYFAEIAAQGERRSAWRDYALFVAGVVVSTVVSIVVDWVRRKRSGQRAGS